MEIHLPFVPMMKIVSYLDAFSLLQVAQVNKSWNAVASSDVLWRKFCRKRWLLCDMDNPNILGTESWKQFYVYRTWQEHTKSRVKPRDFTYKEFPVDFGVRASACYISGPGLTRNRQGKSVVCMVTSMNRISTWDIHEGTMTWESPIQPAYIHLMTTLPEMHIVITVDIKSTIKLWDCQSREALAMNKLFSPCQLLKAVNIEDGLIVLTGDISGNLYIFSSPNLHLISRVNVFPYSIEKLYCSPQKKWVFVSKKHAHILPKISGAWVLGTMGEMVHSEATFSSGPKHIYLILYTDIHSKKPGLQCESLMPHLKEKVQNSPELVLYTEKYVLNQAPSEVFYMSSLLRTAEFSAPMSTSLDFSLCQKAFWTPRREDRITLMCRSGPKKTTKFVTFDMKMENIGNQISVKGYMVAMFWLQEESPEWMGVSDKDVIVCSTVSSLLLFSMKGVRLQTFEYSSEEILTLWVDPVHVIVTFNDGSLDVYAWEERSSLLRRCYGLPNRRSLPPQSMFNKTLCDDVSIIRMMTNGSGPCFLMAYTLKSDLEK